MPRTGQKQRLSENHRRVISALLRSLERMSEGVELWLDKKPSATLRLKNDLTPDHRSKLSSLLAGFRDEIQRTTTEVEIDVAVESPKHAIRALLFASLVDLEDSDSSRLKGYGHLSEEVKDKLDAELTRLHSLLEEMVEVLERD